MTNTEIVELLKAVDDINEMIGEQLGEDPDIWPYLQIEHRSYDTTVMFLNECIWSSENDDRERKSEPYPPPTRGFKVVTEAWEPYLKRKMQAVIDQIKAIQL